MAISGKEPIQIGLQNESIGSDSLYTAFNKTANNFTTLFSNASPYNTFTGNGVSIAANSTAGTVDITNTGVTNIVAGTNISINASNGNVTISSAGGNGNGGGTVTSVSMNSDSLAIYTDAGPNVRTINSSGTFFVNLVGSGVTPGTYTYPTLNVDQYGRVTSASNSASVGTVTSVGLTPGQGIQVTGTNPITSSGSITVTNTGVTRLSAGQGISVSSSNGNVTISSTAVSGGTVTSVGLTSSTLTVTGSPITTTGAFTVDLPSAISVSGNVTGGNLSTTGIAILNSSENLASGGAANLQLTASYFSTTTAATATLAAGSAGQIKNFMMVSTTGNAMVITVSNAGWKASGTGTASFNAIGAGCSLQYINSKWFCVGNNGAVFA